MGHSGPILHCPAKRLWPLMYEKLKDSGALVQRLTDLGNQMLGQKVYVKGVCIAHITSFYIDERNESLALGIQWDDVVEDVATRGGAQVGN